MVGKRMACPSCKKKLDVVTPDEDGYVAYGVGDVRVEKKTQEAEDEELEKLEEIQEKERRAKRKENIRWTLSVLTILGMLGGTAYGFYKFVYEGYNERRTANEKRRAEDKEDLFGKTFKVD